jgi:hypothetical protein
MIEPAYYTNVCEGARIHGKRLVSWHLHLIAWGISPREMKKRIERLNQGILLPIADGLPAAHQKRISKGKLASKIAYVLKAPRKAYRLYKWETVSPDGKIIPKFKQWKDDFRPGERLTLFRLMQDLYLDQLALAVCSGNRSMLTLRIDGILSGSVSRISSSMNTGTASDGCARISCFWRIKMSFPAKHCKRRELCCALLR